MKLWPLRQALAGFATAVALTSAAFGGEIDTTNGKLEPSSTALTVSFDDATPPDGLAIHHYNGSIAPMSADDVSALLDGGGQVLEGTRAIVMGGSASPLMIVDTESVRARFADRRVRVRFWFRAEGTRPRAFVIWMSGDVDAALATPDFSGLHDIGLLPLLPSGRKTDDGWIELTSGPFDFLLAHRIAPLIFIDDELRLEQPPFAPNVEGRVRVDALEIEDVGPAVVADVACTLVNEDTTCGSAGLCHLGRCVDSAVVDGPSFALERLRDEYIERRIFERQTFSGHRAARRNLDRFEQEVAQIVAEPNKRFWSRFNLATDRLEDGHAGGIGINPLTPITGGVCLQTSEADLLPTPRELPMVYRTVAGHPVSRGLRTGDVLSAIDGLPPDEWQTLADAYLRYPADARGRSFITTPQLAAVAMSKGATLTFLRCDGAAACSESDLSTIVVTTATMTAAFWDGRPPPWRGNQVLCEPRFSRLPDDGDIAQSGHVANETRDGVHILEINATPGNVSSWFSETRAAFQPAPDRMILDERLGQGGSLGAVQWLTSFFFEPGIYPANILVPWLSTFEDDVDLRRRMFACSRDTGSPTWGYSICGGALVADNSFVQGMNTEANAGANTRLAILTGLDGSGNDWLTYNLRVLRPAGLTRVFGPVPLFGAYGELAGLPIHRIGFIGGSFQMTGGVILGSDSDPLDAQVGGRGVEPDEVILQRQSDAVRGVDTQLEAAMSWVRGTP